MTSPALPECVVKPPALCTDREIEEFVGLVAAAGKVSTVGLLGRVRRARLLAFLRLDGKLIGVAGLKYPGQGYRNCVAAKSGEPLPQATFECELGWVSVAPGAEGGKSKALCEPLLEAVPGLGVFSTTGTDNERMQARLAKLGFERVGGEWESTETEEVLCLFTKPPPVAVAP